MTIDNLQLLGQQSQYENTALFTLIAPLLAQGATLDSGPQDNPSARGIVIIAKLANEVGIAGYTPQLIIEDEDGNDIVYWAGAELTAAGTTTYVLYPGAMAGAGSGVTANASIILPRTFIFRLSKTTGNSAQTFDVEAYAMYLI